MTKWLLVCGLVVGSSALSFDLDSLLIQSVGGSKAIERLKTLTSVSAEGEMTINQMSGKFTQFFVPPDKYYLEVNMPGFSMIQAYDGKTAWQRDINGQVSELNGLEKKELLKNLYFESFAYLVADSLTERRSYLGKTWLEDGFYHKVAFYPYEDDTLTVYIDAASGLKKIVHSHLDHILTVSEIGDYRTVEGMLFPFYTKSEVEAANFTSTIKASSINLDKPVPNGIFQMPETDKKDFSFPGHASSVVIPIQYRNGHLRVPVLINGKTRRLMILDSGASANIFHSPALKSLNLEKVGTLPAVGISGFDEVELVKIDSLSIGDLKLYDQVSGALPMGSVASHVENDTAFGGLLGYDFLSRFPILLNYRDSTMTVFDPQNFDLPEGGNEIPFYLTMQVPTINGELNGIGGDFIVDLGNAYGLIIHQQFSRQNNLDNILSDIQENPRLVGGIGGALSGRNAYAASFKMGDILIQSLRVLLPDSSLGLTGSNQIAGNIGNLVLENFKVLFDYANSRLVFYKNE